MGAYIGQNNPTELLFLVGLGVLATILRLASFSLPPRLIGFILGPMLENNFSRASQLYDGVSFVWERPMTTVLLAIAVLLIVLPSLKSRFGKVKFSDV
jgi:putative tricarboxylic transport membrane protein